MFMTKQVVSKGGSEGESERKVGGRLERSIEAREDPQEVLNSGKMDRTNHSIWNVHSDFC